MRPLTILLGIVTGSALAIAVSLGMTAIVFLFLGEYADRLQAERWPLAIGLCWSWALTAIGVLSFVAELKLKRWRRAPQLILAAALSVLIWTYWP